MSMNQAKVWIQHPAYTEAEWQSRNPFLLAGEIAFVKDSSSGIVLKSKVGPGYFNDLGYLNDLYPYADVPTNPVGDANSNISGLSIPEIVYKMLNPYQPPVVSNVVNDAGGSIGNARIIEIGKAVSSPVRVTYSVSNPANLLGATPITVNTGGVFQNDGNFANGILILSRDTSLNPTVTSKTTISVKATHQKGETSEAVTTISHYPKIIWGVSPNATILPADWATLIGRKTLITNSFENDYEFITTGYGHLAIPTMLAPGGLKFIDVTNPNARDGYAMVDMGTQSINNGVTTYSYQHYRTEFFMTVRSVLEVKK